MDWLECGVLFTVALIATIALTPLAKRLAVRLDAIDYPSSRRVNNRPIPRLGGAAILGGLFVCLLVLFIGMRWAGWRTPFVSYPGMPINYLVMLAGVLFMFAVGFVDDVISLRPRIKFAGQVVAATIVAASGLLLSSIHNPFGPGFIEFGWLAYPLTIFYLVAFANIINLIDGLDGLAARLLLLGHDVLQPVGQVVSLVSGHQATSGRSRSWRGSRRRPPGTRAGRARPGSRRTSGPGSRPSRGRAP